MALLGTWQRRVYVKKGADKSTFPTQVAVLSTYSRSEYAPAARATHRQPALGSALLAIAGHLGVPEDNYGRL